MTDNEKPKEKTLDGLEVTVLNRNELLLENHKNGVPTSAKDTTKQLQHKLLSRLFGIGKDKF